VRFRLHVSSQFTHHLTDDQIVAFIRWMEAHARRGWFIGDLASALVPVLRLRLLAWLARWHPFVLSDGRSRSRAASSPTLAPSDRNCRAETRRCRDNLASAVSPLRRTTMPPTRMTGAVVIGGGPAGAAEPP